MKRTKIVCTIGPASEDLKTLTAMVRNGMNVARLNFSHGTYSNHAMLMRNIRAVSRKLGTTVAIIQDLQGPKIRVSELSSPLSVKPGQSVVVGKDFHMDFDVSGDIKVGQRMLIEDGIIELKVKKVKGKQITCTVVTGGTIKTHKGINLPDTRLKARVFTDKDFEDLKFGLSKDVDFVALSFVRNKKDILAVKDLIKKYTPKDSPRPQIIAKIEVPEAIENFDEILSATDAIMVARGDLGVEIADSQVPVLQKMMIRKCQAAAKPVIVATQMLESMIKSPRPTRAEASDVANAVIDRADAVMLSGESAFGKYPVQAVTEMNNIIIATETSPYGTSLCRYEGEEDTGEIAVLSDSVAYLAETVRASAIIAATHTGFTARFLSHPRPEVPIIMLTDKPKVMRQMGLLWGVCPILIKRIDQVLPLLEQAVKETKKMKLVKKGDRVVLVTGNPAGRRVNLIEVKIVE